MSGNFTTTPNLGLFKPSIAADYGQWGSHLNANSDKLDAAMGPGGGVFLPLSGGTLSAGASFGITGTSPITGFGTGIGQALGPLINFQGSGVPGLQHTGLILDRAVPIANGGSDVHIRRDANYSGGTSANLNFALLVDVNVEATAGSQEWATLSQIHTSSTSGGAAVGGYFQAWRMAGNGAPIGLISDTADQIGTRSSLSGSLVSCEFDLSATDVDDGANSGAFGGVGVRKMVHLVFAQPSATLNSEYTSGLWFGTQTNGSATAYVDSLLAVQGGSQTTHIRNFIDARGAAAPPGVTDPVAAVRMAATQIIDFNGGPALNSVPGNYLQYTTAGGNRLRYMAGTNERWSISDAGTLTTSGTIASNTNGFNLLGASGATAFHVDDPGAGQPGISWTFSSGTNTWTLGGSSATNVLIGLGGGAFTSPAYTVGVAGGPTIRSGAGAATGTQSSGSIWIRTDGAAGSRIYINQGGSTWAAVAGV